MTDRQSEDTDGSDMHDAFADPAACGLASALLLLFAVLLNRAAGLSMVPATASVTVTVEFARPPAHPFVVVGRMNGKTLFAGRDGRLVPGEWFAHERENRTVPLFDNPKADVKASAAFFRTAKADRPAVTFNAKPPAADGDPPAPRWEFDLTVQFPRNASRLRFDLTFGEGAEPTAVTVGGDGGQSKRSVRKVAAPGTKSVVFSVAEGQPFLDEGFLR